MVHILPISSSLERSNANAGDRDFFFLIGKCYRSSKILPREVKERSTAARLVCSLRLWTKARARLYLFIWYSVCLLSRWPPSYNIEHPSGCDCQTALDYPFFLLHRKWNPSLSITIFTLLYRVVFFFFFVRLFSFVSMNTLNRLFWGVCFRFVKIISLFTCITFA